MKPIDRLKQQYYYVLYYKIDEEVKKYRKIRYQAMKEFCLDCSLLSPAEIEEMERSVGVEH